MPLQDTDNFIVGRGTDSYKISYEDLKDDLNFVPAPEGAVATPTVLEPYDGAGATRYPKSDSITSVGTVSVNSEWIESANGLPAGQEWYDISLTAGRWIICGSNGNFYTSTDEGANWTKINHGKGTNFFFTKIAYNGSRWVAMASTDRKFYSDNGTSWSHSQGGSGEVLFNVAYGNGYWIYTRIRGKIHTSTNGSSWSSSFQPINSGATLYKAFYGDDGNWVIAGGTGTTGYMSVCTNGDPSSSGNWDYKSISPASCTDIKALKQANGVWIIGTDTGQIYTATNPTSAGNWVKKVSPFTNQIREIDYSPSSDTWIAVGYDGAIAYSTDNGNTWELENTSYFGSNNIFSAYDIGNGLWIAGAQSSKLATREQGSSEAVLTLASDTQLDEFSGEVFITDGSGDPGPYTPTNYTLTTTTVQSVDDTDPNNIVLTFSGTTNSNLDLQYFQEGDVIQASTAPTTYTAFKLLRGTADFDAANPVFDINNCDYSATEAYGQEPQNPPPSDGTNGSWIMFDLGQPLSGLKFKLGYSGSHVTWEVQSSQDGINWVYDHEKEANVGDPAETVSTTGVSARYWRMGRTDNKNVMVYSNFFLSDDFLPNAATVVSTGYVNGNNTMTVDGGEWEVGDVITFHVNAGVGDITDITDTTITLKPTSGRFIGPNSSGIDFALAGPVIVDTPLLTNEVDLRSSNFAVEPGSDADILKEIIWDIDGTEYNAGTANPWKPLNNLTPNTTHTVRVRHVGANLGTSAWSPSVSFTTGATLRSLFNRIAAIESDEISDDATDSALLTLIANLTARVQALEESN
jgi:hypothetical protein